ncbi:MAG: hypothetical protein ACYTGN_13335 [Planctomycetota bacterium]|jgi:hypothetical protein
MAGLGLIERNAYRSTWHDGLLDLFAGVALLMVGAVWLTDYAGLGGIAPVLLIPFWVPARRRWIEPRAGEVQFSEERVARERRKYAVMFGVGCVALAVGFGLYLWAREGGVGPGLGKVLLAVLLGGASLMVALLLGQPRFLAYAFASLAIGVWAVSAGVHPGFQLLALGAILVLLGATLLVRFLRSHRLGDDAR